MNYKLPIIEKYLQKNYPRVVSNVDFSNSYVYLGSSPEIPEEERRIKLDNILITLDNTKGEYSKPELTKIKLKITEEINENFDLNIRKYASKYDIKFFVLTKITWEKWSSI